MTASCLGALALSPSVTRLSCALQFCMYVDRTHSITWALLLRAHLGNLGTGTREKRPESDIFRFRAHPRSADLLTSPAIELFTPSYSVGIT